MPTMPPAFRPAGQRTEAERRRDDDQRRGSARARGYSAAWDKARDGHLARDPLCVYCEMEGRVVAANTVDHLIPHRGDRVTFWNRRDWISSCADCHDGMKQRLERRPAALTVFANAVRLHLARRGGGSKV